MAALSDSRDSQLSAGDRKRLRQARRVLWGLVAVMHFGYAVGYGFEARYYFETITSPLYFTFLLRVFGRKQHLREEVCFAVLVSSVAVCAWHLVAGFRMVQASFTHKKVLFRRLSVSSLETQPSNLHKSPLNGLVSLLCAPWHWLSRVWSQYGGIDGVYYELFTDLRETFEIVTQTYVVYRLSCFVSHQGINSLASLALVANCWSTPILRTWFVNSKRGPLIRTATGMVLASIFTVVIPFVVFDSYYSLALAPVYTRYDPQEFVDRGNLFQQIFTLTWKDWFSTRLAAVFAIAALETVKRKGNERPRRKKSRAKTARNVIAIVPDASKLERDTSIRSATATGLYNSAYLLKRAATSRVSHRVADVIFFVTGLVVLVLHIEAASHTTPLLNKAGVECTLLMRPWLTGASVCAVVSLNCHRLGIRGTQREWDAVLNPSVHSRTLRNLVGIRISHCPHLEAPSHLQHMKNLIQIVVFNASIASWGPEAALTLAQNPQLTIVSLLRVRNIQHLPLGLLASDFPAIVFEVSDSDLVDLPANLAQLWPPLMEQVNLERSQLSSVPTALLAMQSGRLSLAGNRIRELPAAFFSDHDYFRSLLLTDNPLQSLPTENVVNFKAQEMGLVGTNVSTVPPWVEQAASRPATRRPFVLAANTPLCTHPVTIRPALVQCTPPELPTLRYYIGIDEITKANPP